jgi:FAD/FMN-containing dehydrogenase
MTLNRSNTDETAKRRPWRRLLRVALLSLGIVGVLLARPVAHLLQTAFLDIDERVPVGAGRVDDASRMNETAVHEIVDVPVAFVQAERQLEELLRKAHRDGLKVSIAGARHSMGGHTIYPGGLSVNMLPLKHMELDSDTGILRVQSGALWQDVIPYLDQNGRSVAVMQSNNSFSVGGSISVNCHGWQYGRPPIASTVESFRLMKADGLIVRCSREENAELFSLTLGGYGLFGIILDVALWTVPNARYRLETFVAPAGDSLAVLDEQLRGRSDAAMVLARMSVSQDHFLDEVMLYLFVEDPSPDGSLPKLGEPDFNGLRRHMFRGSIDSDYGKRLRWQAETKLKPILTGSTCSRNQLLNESVEVFENRSAETTDIL